MAKKVKKKRPYIQRVVSGGQTGADIAGLKAAKRLGVNTGGYIPKGFRTDDGPKPKYARRYGLVETKSAGYPDRTKRNVQMADLTLIFSPVHISRGSKLTKKYCEQLNKPYVWCSNFKYKCIEDIIRLIRIQKERRLVINVAGNREESWPGIEREVKKVMSAVILHVNKHRM